MLWVPFDGVQDTLVDRYNAVSKDELEKIRDFIILHYHVTERDDSDFWRYCRNMEIPDSLKHRLALFKESAQAYQADGELFRVDSWTQVMLGQGLIPDHYHHVARKMGEDELSKFLADFRSAIAKSVDKMPTHSEFIERYCKSSVT